MIASCLSLREEYHAIPAGDELVAQVEILSESESTSYWQFDVQILDDRGTLTRHIVRLSWADYNLWSAGGADSPDRVVEAAVQFLVAHKLPSELPDHFDASVARRIIAEADDRIPQFIRG